MARRSLRPQLNQIRTWVRQGRTDAWIAHQLEVPVQQVDAFKREHELLPEGADTVAEIGVDVDLRAADDALIAAELEAEEAARAEAEEAAREAEEEARRAEDAARAEREAAGEVEDEDEDATGRPSVAADAAAGAGEHAAAARPSSRARSITAKRATACGSIPRSPTARSTPSTGPVTAASR